MTVPGRGLCGIEARRVARFAAAEEAFGLGGGQREDGDQNGDERAHARLAPRPAAVAEKARGGIALTMIGGSSVVAPDSPQAFGNFLLYKDECVPWLKELAEDVHEKGAAVMIQITHLGRRTRPISTSPARCGPRRGCRPFTPPASRTSALLDQMLAAPLTVVGLGHEQSVPIF